MIEYGMALKAAADLAAKLDSLVTDRKTRELLLPLKEKPLEAQRENFELQQRHSDTMDNLQSKYRELQRTHAEEMDSLKLQLSVLQSKQSCQPDAVFNPNIGIHVETSTGIHYCPHCRQEDKWSPNHARPPA
jgi:hypothetical protein